MLLLSIYAKLSSHCSLSEVVAINMKGIVERTVYRSNENSFIIMTNRSYLSLVFQDDHFLFLSLLRKILVHCWYIYHNVGLYVYICTCTAIIFLLLVRE